MVVNQYIFVDLWTFMKYKKCYSKTSGKYVPFTYIKLLLIEAFCSLDNHGGSNLTDGLTSPIADPLQVRENLFWNLYVDATREVLWIGFDTNEIFALINHESAPVEVNVWHSTHRTRMYEEYGEF